MISSTVTQYFNCEGRIALKICEAYDGNKSGTALRVNASTGILLTIQNNHFFLLKEVILFEVMNVFLLKEVLECLGISVEIVA